MQSLLQINQLEAYYGDFQALFGVDLTIADGEVVALIGANGAGKSTLIRSIMGFIQAPPTAIYFNGEPIGGAKPNRISEKGIAIVPEGRRLFQSLTVEENLLIGKRNSNLEPFTLELVYDLFPKLKEFRNRNALHLSGGQQQMVAIGRALMANPRLLLCDELSLGLAPRVIEEIYETFFGILKSGVAILLVEQIIDRALAVSSRTYCLREGRIVLEGESDEFDRDTISAAYFGSSNREGANLQVGNYDI
ncbi:MAG: ABC transporter ATP-binding protein [Candidatus Marinimicrobia bacterium]|jgi:branched-chain amino acid transport system ATP-binding protein|nr:ABC transporter ATP-binding protein [Candidatus Neomarinimicrobiota bacterium]